MKFWKNQGKRGLALILALLMCLNMLSLAAFADTEDGEEQPAVVEEENDLLLEGEEGNQPVLLPEDEEPEEAEEEALLTSSPNGQTPPPTQGGPGEQTAPPTNGQPGNQDGPGNGQPTPPTRPPQPGPSTPQEPETPEEEIPEENEEPVTTTNNKPPVPTAWVNGLQLRGTAKPWDRAAGGSSNSSLTRMGFKSGVDYWCSEVMGNDQDGYYVEVTIRLSHGDGFEQYLSDVFTSSTYSSYLGFDDIKAWEYDFDEPTKDITFTLYHQATVARPGSTTLVPNWGVSKDGPFRNASVGLSGITDGLFADLIVVRPCTHTDVILSYTDNGNGTHTVTSTCNKCGEELAPETADHTFGEWTVTKEPTLTEEGERVHSCTLCGAEETETIDKLVPVAELDDGRQFATLQEAADVAAAQFNPGLRQKSEKEEWTITLLADIQESVRFSAVSTLYTGDYHMTLDLNGHTITGNGGPVITLYPTGSANGTFEFVVEDSVGTGTITGGNATSGGAIYVGSGKSGGSLIINGGTFTGNAAVNGGAIWSSYQNNISVYVNGGTFTGNTATGKGGAIYARTLKMTDGTITGNSADAGGGICVGNALVGSSVIRGGQIYGNTATAYGDDIVICGYSGTTGKDTTTLLAAADMGVEGVDSWLVDGYDLTAVGRVSNTNRVVFNAETVTTMNGQIVALKAGAEHLWSAEQYVVIAEATFDAPGAYKIVKRCSACDEEQIIKSGVIPQLVAVARVEETGERYESLQEALTAVRAQYGDAADTRNEWTVTLLNDTTECVSVTLLPILSNNKAAKLTIDLNGCTITGTGAGPVISVAKGGSMSANVEFVIADSVGTGTVTGGNAANGGAIYVSGSASNTSLTINGGNFTGNTATNGGAISSNYQKDVPVVINGGAFTGNTATGKGGAIYARTVTVNGGTFTSNTADMGGAFYVVGGGWTANLTIVSAEVHDNTASTYGDDIVFGLAGSNKYATTLSLMDAASMGIEGISAWMVDGYNLKAVCERASNETFTDAQWPNTNSTGPAIIALKAGAERMYTVTFTVSNQFFGSVNGESTVSVASGESLGNKLPTATGATGYTFIGWKTEDGTPFTADTPVTEDITVIARWQVTFTFSDNKANQVFKPFTVDVEIGESVTIDGDALDEIVVAGKASGWKFLGWATSGSTTSKVVYEPGAPITAVNKTAVKFYAKWELQSTTPEFTSGRYIRIEIRDENGETLTATSFYDTMNTGNKFYTVGEVVANDGSNSAVPASTYPYQCTLTLHTQAMIEKGQSSVGDRVLDGESDPKITLYCRAADGRWATWVDGVGTYSYVVNYVINVKLPSYTVTFNANASWCNITTPDGEVIKGMSGIATYGMTVGGGETIETLPSCFDRSGYDFRGWATEDGKPFTSETEVTGDITVYAQWQRVWTISFYANKTGVTWDDCSLTVDDGAVVPVDEASIIAAGEAAGYEFLGWALSKTATTPVSGYEKGVEITANGGRTLYAVWKVLPTMPTFGENTQIMVSFTCETSTQHGLAPVHVTSEMNDAADGKYFSLGTVVPNTGANAAAYPYQCELTLHLAGFLKHWETGNHVLLGDEDPVITVYLSNTGRWAALPDGGSTIVVSYTAKVKDIEPWSVTVLEAPEAVKPGEVHTWTIELTNNGVVASGNYTDLELYLMDETDTRVYLTDLKVYDSEGDLLSAGFLYDAGIGVIPAGASVKLTIEGVLEDSVSALSSYARVAAWRVSGNGGAWVYSDWLFMDTKQLATYTVTVDGEKNTVKHGDTLAGILPDEEPAREGHTFSGWFNGDVQVTDNTVVTADMTIEPKWDINTYTVTFSPNGGTITGESSIQVQHGGQVTTLPTVRRTGYTFQGWFIGGTRFTTATVITGDVTVEAQWTRNSSGGTTTPGTTNPSTNPPEIEIEDPDVPLAGTPVSAIYEDVEAELWYIPGIQFVHDKGLLDAISDGNFAPNMNVTRSMVVSMLHRLEGAPEASGDCFTDVEAGAWYETAVYWALENGIAVGYGDDCFGPEDNITREQLSVILMHYAESKGYDVTVRNDLSAYEDAEQISEYAVETMSWANAADLIIGDSATTLNPQGTATRAEAATMLLKIYQNFMQTETETEAEED